jgi:hypothetical protein
MLLATAAASPAWAKDGAEGVEQYNVACTSPARDFRAAVPLGNGDVGVSAWAEDGGDLLFYIGKTDAYDDNNRLLKLGRLRVRLSPNPFAKGQPFRQTLRLRQGELAIEAGKDDCAAACRLWVDANQPVIRVEVEGRRPVSAEVVLETWRTAERDITGELSHSDALRGAPGGLRTVQYPDVVLGDRKDSIVWYHHNSKSVWPATMQLQGLEACMEGAADPLLHRTFGGMIIGEGMVGAGPAALKSAQPRQTHRISVYVLARHPSAPEEWLKDLEALAARARAADPEQARAAHLAWWEQFWNRSYVRVSGPATVVTADGPKAGAVTAANLPLRIGADSNGATRFLGKMARVRLWSEALPAEKLAALAARGPDQTAGKDPALVGEWAPGELSGGAVANQAADALAARCVGDLKPVQADGTKALEFTGKGYLEIANDDRLNLAGGLTLEAWIAPDRIGPEGARIIDRSPVGTSEGYLLDTWPGNSLRLIAPTGTIRHDARLAPGKWVHVAGTLDPATGQEVLYVGGKAAARQTGGGPSAPAAVSTFAMSRGYALQRYLMACGGRGNMWTKFNGSIFTLPWEKADPDYRRWAGAQWFQNARVPYWPEIAAGDYDVTAPFYRHYVRNLPMARRRTVIYYGHEGAFFPETQFFWGTYANVDYGWDRRNVPLGFATNNYIRWYWSGCLELTVMMLDQYDNTQDREFLRGTLLPLAGAFLEFYDRHWNRGPDGKILFEPAQSLETWHSATNPLPEIAGLRYIIPRMLALPADAATDAQRAAWKKTLADLPQVPTRTEGQKKFLLPAQKFAAKANVENPELYAVFPYRLYGVGKPDLAVGIETFNRRQHRENRCWWQCDIHAAYLGLAGVAARNVLGRLCNYNTAFAFPAMWGPHNDEVPDMDHGGNGQMALQVMLMQTEGRKILLLPAWPKAWDVEFRLHAPANTVVEGVFRGGKMEQLKVTPPERAKDVVMMPPQ